MAWFRSKLCGDTYNTLCMVPIDGLPLFESEDDWCKAFYNSTDCARIRDDAQATMIPFAYSYFNANGAVAVALAVLVSEQAYPLVSGRVS